MTRLVAIATLAAVIGAAVPLQAAVTQRELNKVAAAPPAQATLPLNLSLRGEDDISKPLRFWLGKKPSVWVFADYTCKTLCGPVISIVSDALAKSGLRAGEDFRLIVVGLDPKDTAADAASMKLAQVGRDNENSAASDFLRGDSDAIEVLAKALGFSFIYDREADQFAHPAAAFVIAPGGQLARALPGLAVDPLTIRLAIIDASNGIIGTWADHIRLLCYGYDPASGTYSVAIGRLLAASGGMTIAALTLLIGLLLRREHAARRGGINLDHLKARSQTTTIE